MHALASAGCMRPGRHPLALTLTLVGLGSIAAACSSARSDAPPHATPDATPQGDTREPPTARTASPKPTDSAARPSAKGEEIHGRLRTVQGQRVLQVWGSPAQMGRAHGRLLRAEILEIVDGYALDVIPPAMLDTAAGVYTTVADIPPRLSEEAEGIVAGMEAAGGAHSERLGRSLRAADLLVLNAMTDLLAIGCSSVSAWGSATAGSDLAGAPAIVRNLDWSEDPELRRNQVIIAYLPDDPTRQPVVSVAFAGYIGCLSCMNEAGVAALFNMGYGEGAASPTQALAGFSPANLLLRDTLERRDVDGDGRATADDVEAAWRDHTHAGSYILHVLEPRRPDPGGAAPARVLPARVLPARVLPARVLPARVLPARVLEVEADGVVTRRADAPESSLGGDLLAATNHLRSKAAPTSCSRYDTIEREAAARSQRFDRDALWKLGTRLRLPQVVHTVLVEPESRQLSVWLRGPEAAPEDAISPVVHPWADLIGPAAHE